jgi:hypothetical protein
LEQLGRQEHHLFQQEDHLLYFQQLHQQVVEVEEEILREEDLK